jgi:AcrR family transcriptional regulator
MAMGNTESPRPLRADARRNRIQVLATAQKVFAEQGLSAPMDDIARQAGVGVGTLYRHFPTKEALFEAIVRIRIEKMEEEARALSSSTEPGKAFFGYFSRMVREAQSKIDFLDDLLSVGIDIKPSLNESYGGLWKAVERLLVNAQNCGAVRSDIGIHEVERLLTGLLRAFDFHAPDEKKVRENLILVVADGLKTHLSKRGASGIRVE